MKKLIRNSFALVGAALMAASTAPAQADEIDDIIGKGTLRCGVMLDFPPAGFRNSSNEPDGFDVQYCKDMAKALGVEAEVVETPSPERVPALVSKRVDVMIASASNTLERAKTVAFTMPYVVYTNVVITQKDSDIKSFEDLRGRSVGNVVGTTPEQFFLEHFEKWDDPNGNYTGFGSDAESYLAVSQGKVEAIIGSSAQAADLIASGNFPNLEIRAEAPFTVDLVSIAVNKNDHSLLRWANLFVWEQQKSGRYAELYKQYFRSDEVPALTIPNTYY